MYPLDTPALTDGSATHIFTMQDFGSNATLRNEAAAPSDLPHTLTIKHQEIGKSNDVNRRIRSNVSLSRKVKDALGNYGSIVYSSTLDWPPAITTAAEAQKEVTLFLTFINTSGYLAKLTSKEV